MADPMMAAFSAYRQKRRVRDFQGTLAWITNFSSRSGWKNAATELYYEGAAERAHELGYKLEEFWLKEPGMTNRRASAILLNRGMRGLLLCPQPKARGHLSIHWPDFSAVSLGYSMVRPNLHLVTTAHFRSMVRKLRGLGHKKIGFVCSDRANERNDRLCSAAFEAEKVGSRRQAEIPIFLYDHDTKDRKAFLKWRGQHNPDAIILAAPDEDISLWLCDASPSIAESTSIASLGLQMRDGEHAGIDERSTLIGRAAVDLVWRMLQHGERYSRCAYPDPNRGCLDGRHERDAQESTLIHCGVSEGEASSVLMVARCWTFRRT
jgi:DNA-binding LacI/PurR family transcriptional regulator